MLQVDPEKRPDIYQVSALAFRIVGRETPVQNLHVSCYILKRQLNIVLFSIQSQLCVLNSITFIQ